MALSLIFLGTLPSVAYTYDKGEQWSYPSSNPGRESFAGSGTASSPYLIQCAQDLVNLAYIVTDNNDDVEGLYFKMTRDIYLNDFTVDANGNITANGELKSWTPIGEYGTIWDDDFQGIFDGGGHTIYGLYLEEKGSRRFLGLFGSMEYATIKNLNIKNAYLYAEPTDNIVQLGALVGNCTSSTISNVSVENCYTQIVKSVNATSQHGGIIGVAYDEVTLNNCSFSGNIYNSNSDENQVYVGGLVGDLRNT